MTETASVVLSKEVTVQGRWLNCRLEPGELSLLSDLPRPLVGGQGWSRVFSSPDMPPSALSLAHLFSLAKGFPCSRDDAGADEAMADSGS
jgi:hypothetical protein